METETHIKLETVSKISKKIDLNLIAILQDFIFMASTLHFLNLEKLVIV